MSTEAPIKLAHGTPVWFDLRAVDVERAKKFYTAVFRWEFSAFPDPSGSTSSGSSENDDDESAMFTITDPRMAKLGIGGSITRVKADEHVKGRGSTRLYLQVDDMDEASANIEKAGGKLLGEKEHPPGDEGWLRVFEDCEGNVQGLYAAAAKEAKESA